MNGILCLETEICSDSMSFVVRHQELCYHTIAGRVDVESLHDAEFSWVDGTTARTCRHHHHLLHWSHPVPRLARTNEELATWTHWSTVNGWSTVDWRSSRAGRCEWLRYSSWTGGSRPACCCSSLQLDDAQSYSTQILHNN